MPADKSYTHAVRVDLGHFEFGLLECLVKVGGGSYASHIRNAIRYYAQQSPSLNPEWVRNQFSGHKIPDVPDSTEDIGLSFAIRRFAERSEQPLTDAGVENLPLRMSKFSLTAADFVDKE